VINIPTTCGHKDSKGYFCRWGKSGAKYYYDPNDKASRERAKKKADKQGAAIQANKSEENDEEIIEIEITKSVKNDENCSECEQKIAKIIENSEKNEENDTKIDKNEQKVTKNEQKLAKNDEKVTITNLKDGNFIKYNGKIGKILKKLNLIALPDGSYLIVSDDNLEVANEADLQECKECNF